MKTIIMCGGTYAKWDIPKPMTPIKSEPKDIKLFERFI